jgi:hypothetical protein
MMRTLLTNGLEDIGTALDPGAVCAGIIQTWQEVLFSDLPDHSLRRYFTCQLEGISKIRDTLPAAKETGMAETLSELTDHLLSKYLKYIDRDLPVPDCYRKKILEDLLDDFLFVSEKMVWCKPVVDYLAEFEAPGNNLYFSFRSLDYFRLMITELAALGKDSPEDLLVSLNFNHLGYLLYLQQGASEKLSMMGCDGERKAWLLAESARVKALPERIEAVYHPDWPTLKTMLTAWLGEQAAPLRETSPVMKLPLNLSVAQLACWIRLFYEEDCYKETNLTAIFNFYASVYSTKKQISISSGSLSKEYYGTDQVTAAAVLDKLQKMTTRINRNFFPVWIAAGAAILFR